MPLVPPRALLRLFRPQARLSLDPAKLPRLRPDGAEVPAGANARGAWVVSRALLRYRLFSLVDIAMQDRPGALQAQLAAWQPFPDAIYLVDLWGDQAQVFALESSVAAQSGAGDRPLWPESLLHESGADGLRLVEGLDGFEAQSWRAGVLLSSRWWAAVPPADEWLTFARQARCAALEMPSAERLQWRRPTRAVQRGDRLGRAALGKQRLLVAAVALVLLAFTGVAARDAWDAWQQRDRDTQGVVALKQEVAPLLAARDRALGAADQATAFAKQMVAPMPLQLIDQLAQLLPKGALLRELDWQGGTLRIALELPSDVSRTKVVNDLESGGWFVQVSEVKDSQPRAWVSFEMKLTGPLPPGGRNNDAGLRRGAAERPAPPDIGPIGGQGKS